LVIWNQYLQNVADTLNTSVTQAGIISSLITIIAVMIVVLIATRAKGAIVTVPLTMFFNLLLFIYIGWFPIWIGSVMALVIVIFLGYVLGKTVGVT
jgi:hypothetical protein